MIITSRAIRASILASAAAGGLAFAGMLSAPASSQTITLAARGGVFYDDFSSGGLVERDSVDFLVTTPTFEFPMVGGAASVNFDRLPNMQFSLSAAFGEDTVQRTLLGGVPVDDPGSVVSLVRTDTEATASRTDIEFTVQRATNERFSWLAGLRYEQSEIDFTGTITSRSSTLPEDDRFGSVPVAFEDGYRLYTARAGVSGSIPITRDTRHRAYAAGLLFAGARDAKSGGDGVPLDDATIAGPDLAVGYSWTLNPNVSLDARYRAMAFYFLSGRRDFSDTDISHGLTVSANVTF